MGTESPSRRLLLLGTVVVALVGTVVGLALLLVAPRAASAADSAGLVAYAVGFMVVPWSSVWAVSIRRGRLAAVGLTLTSGGFCLLARDGFPLVAAGMGSLLLALLALRATGDPRLRRGSRPAGR